jgi:metal-sulfur cluster biosynthetic enzyme
MPNEQAIIEILKTIPDPEIGISIYDLGLVYRIENNEKTKVVTITITLTSIGCPLFSLIADPIKEKVMNLDDVKEVIVELTFEPPWSADKMSEDAKMQLGF